MYAFVNIFTVMISIHIVAYRGMSNLVDFQTLQWVLGQW